MPGWKRLSGAAYRQQREKRQKELEKLSRTSKKYFKKVDNQGESSKQCIEGDYSSTDEDRSNQRLPLSTDKDEQQSDQRLSSITDKDEQSQSIQRFTTSAEESRNEELLSKSKTEEQLLEGGETDIGSDPSTWLTIITDTM